jgi:hypothetical protein
VTGLCELCERHPAVVISPLGYTVCRHCITAISWELASDAARKPDGEHRGVWWT